MWKNDMKQEALNDLMLKERILRLQLSMAQEV